MTTHPKYKIERNANVLEARELGTKKKVSTTGVGVGLVGSALISFIVFLAVGLIFNKDAGITAGVIVGILCVIAIVADIAMQREYEESLTVHPFFKESTRLADKVWSVKKTLDEALSLDDYRIEAETIVDAGIAGFNSAVDDDGQLKVSDVIEEATSGLQRKMQEHKNVHNVTAEDVTRNYLEGFR